MDKPGVGVVVLMLAFFGVGCVLGATLAEVSWVETAPGAAATGTATVTLPDTVLGGQGTFAWEGKATYKCAADGTLLWCRVEPWRAGGDDGGR